MLKFRFDRRIREVLSQIFKCCDASALCQGLLLWSPSGIHALTRGNSAVIWLLIVHLIEHRIGKIAVVLAGETAFRCSRTWIGSPCHHAKVEKMMELKTVL